MAKAHPFYNSPAWRTVRKLALARDGYVCVECGSTGPRLQVDHIQPMKLFPHLALNLANLRTLCMECHARQETSLGRSANYKQKPKIGLDGFPEGSEWS